MEVEQAISLKANLNAIVLDDSGCRHSFHDSDDYALLHLAVINDHLDALQRLLNTGAVEINKPTGRRGRTALCLAAEEDRVHAATMLIEHNADVNALTDEGQSALIVASSRGHKKMVALLEEHGADKTQLWMGLNAEDVKLRRIESSDSDRSSTHGGQRGKRTVTERALLQGQPGWLQRNDSEESSASDRSDRSESVTPRRGSRAASVSSEF